MGAVIVFDKIADLPEFYDTSYRNGDRRLVSWRGEDWFFEFIGAVLYELFLPIHCTPKLEEIFRDNCGWFHDVYFPESRPFGPSIEMFFLDFGELPYFERAEFSKALDKLLQSVEAERLEIQKWNWKAKKEYYVSNLKSLKHFVDSHLRLDSK